MRHMLPFLLAIVVPGCGNDSPTALAPPPTTLPARSVITVTVSPNPILATPSGNPSFPWRMDYSVTIAETAGLACNVNRLVRSYLDCNAFGCREFLKGESNPDDLQRVSGTNFIAGGGTLSGGSYGLTYGPGRQITLNVSVEVIDAYNNRVTATTGNVSVLWRAAAQPIE